MSIELFNVELSSLEPLQSNPIPHQNGTIFEVKVAPMQHQNSHKYSMINNIAALFMGYFFKIKNSKNIV